MPQNSAFHTSPQHDIEPRARDALLISNYLLTCVQGLGLGISCDLSTCLSSLPWIMLPGCAKHANLMSFPGVRPLCLPITHMNLGSEAGYRGSLSLALPHFLVLSAAFPPIEFNSPVREAFVGPRFGLWWLCPLGSSCLSFKEGSIHSPVMLS